MRIILDTNVFVSGIFWSGPPYHILKAWQAGDIKIVLSKEILNEYDRVSHALSEKFPGVNLLPFIELITIYGEMHTPIKFSGKISRDLDDDKFIICALSAGVKKIISGDKDLLSLSHYQDIEIISPASFVKRYLI